MGSNSGHARGGHDTARDIGPVWIALRYRSKIGSTGITTGSEAGSGSVKRKSLLNRAFHGDGSGRKWGADISYIHTRQGILCLSVIRDLYDNSIVTHKTGTHQTVHLVLDTIHLTSIQHYSRKPAALSDAGEMIDHYIHL